jgi:hypothetical protein
MGAVAYDGRPSNDWGCLTNAWLNFGAFSLKSQNRELMFTFCNALVVGGGGGSRTLFPQDKSLSINSFWNLQNARKSTMPAGITKFVQKTHQLGASVLGY